MLTELKGFLKECHFDVITFPLNVGPATLLPGKAVTWRIPLPWRAKYKTFLAGVQDAPWWTNMSREEMSTVMDALMRAKIVLFDGIQKNATLDPEFARHIGHLAEYAPLNK